MRTRIFATPINGTPTAAWQDGDATAGQAGALLPFSTAGGLPAGSSGTLEGPGSFVSAQFSLATAPAVLYVALATNGASSGVTVYLESYSSFAWVVLDSSALSASSGSAVNLPAATQLGLLRLRVAISGRASAQCVALLNSTATATPGGGNSGGSDNGNWEFRTDLTGAIGGTATDLDSVDTTSIDFGHVIAFNFADQAAAYQYQAYTNPGGGGNPSPNSISRFKSVDYNAAGVNNGHWVRIL